MGIGPERLNVTHATDQLFDRQALLESEANDFGHLHILEHEVAERQGDIAHFRPGIGRLAPWSIKLVLWRPRWSAMNPVVEVAIARLPESVRNRLNSGEPPWTDFGATDLSAWEPDDASAEL